jgi:NMD protein affecting ribosome stability and mRNA decay
MSWKDGEVAARGRKDRLIKEKVHDPYKARCKLSKSTVCPECKAAFRDGRWRWVPTAPKKAHFELCPACQRIRDRVPAGFLSLSGEFVDKHRDEIMLLLQNKVERQRKQHPMKRMMDIEEQKDGSTMITFTDMHLPRGVGEAIKNAYEGELDIQYTKGAGIVRVYWQR